MATRTWQQAVAAAEASRYPAHGDEPADDCNLAHHVDELEGHLLAMVRAAVKAGKSDALMAADPAFAAPKPTNRIERARVALRLLPIVAAL